MSYVNMLWFVMSYYPDGSGEPEILAIFDAEERANKLKAIIQSALPSKKVMVSCAEHWQIIETE